MSSKMPLPHSSIFRDEELGKKDDDHKPRPKSQIGEFWQRRRVPHRRSWKKVVIGIIVLIGLYYFYKNMPTDLRNPRPRPRYLHGSEIGNSATQEKPPSASDGGEPDEEGHSFNGRIKFYQLAPSLRAFIYGNVVQQGPANRNVVCLTKS